jgi:hypothetical protein
MLKVLEQHPAKRTLRTVLSIAASLTFSEAMDLLDALDEGFLKATIYTDEEWGGKPFGELGHDPYNLIKTCDSVGTLWFQGGPPGREYWFEGMACQYVADCILRSIVTLGEVVVGAKIGTVMRQGAP